MMTNWRTFIFICVLLIPQIGFSQLHFEDSVFPELVTSARALAMGNAYVAKADDSAAAFYNPAGLGTVREPSFHLSNFQFDMNKGWSDAALGGSLTDAGGNFFKAFNEDGLREILVEKPGVTTFNRMQFMPNFTMRYFSLGYMYSKKTKARVTKDATEYHYIYRRDHGPYASLNFSFWGGIFKIGMTGAMVSRKEAEVKTNPNTTLELGDNDYKKGSAFIGIAGAKLTLPYKLLPTFAVTSHNAFEKEFSSRAAGQPKSITKTLDAGFSITPQIGNVVRLHLEANYKDVEGNVAGVSSGRRILLGMEMDIARRFFFRLGYGDGFGSAGLGVKSRKLQFDLTTYAVDRTKDDFRGDEDRRFAFSLSSGF